MTAGDPATTAMRRYTAAGVTRWTVRGDTLLFRDAHSAELAHFTDCVRT